MSMDMADSFISVEGSMGDEERQQEKWATIEEEEAEYDEDDEDEAEVDGIGADMGDVASPSKKRRGVKRKKPRNHEVCDGHDHASHHASQSFDKSPSVGRGEVRCSVAWSGGWNALVIISGCADTFAG